jgi:hypothetical protein
MSEPRRARGGRPPLVAGDTSTPITVRVPTREFDRACQQAARDRVPVAELVRRALARALHDADPDE